MINCRKLVDPSLSTGFFHKVLFASLGILFLLQSASSLLASSAAINWHNFFKWPSISNDFRPCCESVFLVEGEKYITKRFMTKESQKLANVLASSFKNKNEVSSASRRSSFLLELKR